MLGDAAGSAVEDLVVVAEHLHAGQPPAVVAEASGEDADEGALSRAGVAENADPTPTARPRQRNKKQKGETNMTIHDVIRIRAGPLASMGRGGRVGAGAHFRTDRKRRYGD